MIWPTLLSATFSREESCSRASRSSLLSRLARRPKAVGTELPTASATEICSLEAALNRFTRVLPSRFAMTLLSSSETLSNSSSRANCCSTACSMASGLSGSSFLSSLLGLAPAKVVCGSPSRPALGFFFFSSSDSSWFWLGGCCEDSASTTVGALMRLSFCGSCSDFESPPPDCSLRFTPATFGGSLG